MSVCSKKVLLFGEASELVGCKEIHLPFPKSCTQKALKSIVIDQLAELEPLKDCITLAVNWCYLDTEDSINSISVEEIEEIAVLPPISGG
uniref:Molybdopterin synthase sulfur carrier subunit n=1 Tax=Trichobilharzia regenti TaxID=157069 RepID=A0AA85JJU1_TRIRE|nr:unnamed protein product [Trichobilharzia regenti]